MNILVAALGINVRYVGIGHVEVVTAFDFSATTLRHIILVVSPRRIVPIFIIRDTAATNIFLQGIHGISALFIVVIVVKCICDATAELFLECRTIDDKDKRDGKNRQKEDEDEQRVKVEKPGGALGREAHGTHADEYHEETGDDKWNVDGHARRERKKVLEHDHANNAGH